MYKTILVAIDPEHGDHNRRILSAAKAAAEMDGADVHLLTVVAAAPAIVSQFLHENYEQMASGQAKQALSDQAAEAGFDKAKVSSSIRFGTIYEEILAAAEAIGADLIVTGSHKPNVSDYLLGSNAARVVRHAGCSVMVIR